MSARAALVIVSLLLGGACGSTTHGGPATDSLTPEDFAARYASAHCELTSRCCDFSGGEPQTDECEGEKLAEQRADADAAARSGARFNVKDAEGCLALFEDRACDPSSSNLADHFLPVCNVWRGQLHLGEACEADLECELEVDGLLRCIDGECRNFRVLFPGEPCDPQSTTEVCGFNCDPETLLCAEIPFPGDPCADECAFGATCVDGLCELPGVAGSPCTVGSECQNGLCVEGRCASMLIGDHCAAPE